MSLLILLNELRKVVNEDERFAQLEDLEPEGIVAEDIYVPAQKLYMSFRGDSFSSYRQGMGKILERFLTPEEMETLHYLEEDSINLSSRQILTQMMGVEYVPWGEGAEMLEKRWRDQAT